MVINQHLWFIHDYQRPKLGSIYDARVQQVLSKYYNHQELATLTYTSNGKPVINSSRYYFNLAHSKNLLVIAISSYPLGIDIEFINPKKIHQKIAKKYFSEIEVSQMGFYYSWTAKEALIKLLGERLFSLLPHISLHKNNDNYIAFLNGINYRIYFLNKFNFLIAICQKESNIMPIEIFELK